MSHSTLTPRELEVLESLVKGLTNKEIAARLGLSEVTVTQHVSHLLHKMNMGDRTQAAIQALQRGLVHLHELANG